ncbi:hypothetical protein DV737_g2155, partial [Chaetothyriales sp. CBS 132003]
MASIFTYQDEPPRIHSPWSTPGYATPSDRLRDPSRHGPHNASSGITRLDPEKHDGSCEYKLHLLLRPRRQFASMTTADPSTVALDVTSLTTSLSPNDTFYQRSRHQPSPRSRQGRLQQLTTQLLWRLQQSSPFHSSSTTELVLPVLPEATPRLGVPDRPNKLLPGLEESQGALYEIGVADDGVLVGLVDDELEESLNNLRAMAASLGCVVDILRKVQVGSCEWIELVADQSRAETHCDKLYVAEVLVRPDSRAAPDIILADGAHSSADIPVEANSLNDKVTATRVEQVRVAFVGATTSANDGETESGIEPLNMPDALDLDLSLAYLNLCLRLHLPLVIVITKMDLATKLGLRKVLAKVLSAVKSAGRKPLMLTAASRPIPAFALDSNEALPNLQRISQSEVTEVDQAITSIAEEGGDIVPLLMVSAVTGSGIGKLHALLQRLPAPFVDENRSTVDHALFRIDEVFSIPPSRVYTVNAEKQPSPAGLVLCGYLEIGNINIGDIMVLSPVTNDELGKLTPISHSKSCTSQDLQKTFRGLHLAKSYQEKSWTNSPAKSNVMQHDLRVRVVSVRNLRLPIRNMNQGETGTIGIEFMDQSSFASLQRVRKGMILATGVPDQPASHSFIAAFPASDFSSASSPLLILGGDAIVYINTIRAAVKVIAVALAADGRDKSASSAEMFAFDSDGEQAVDDGEEKEIRISFRFASTIERIEEGDQVLVVPTVNAAGSTPSQTLKVKNTESVAAGSRNNPKARVGEFFCIGIFSTNAKDIFDRFTNMVKKLDETLLSPATAAQSGYLGGACFERRDINGCFETVFISYWRSAEDIHNWAYGPVHRETWEWWNRLTVEESKHIGINHEIFARPATNHGRPPTRAELVAEATLAVSMTDVNSYNRQDGPKELRTSPSHAISSASGYKSGSSRASEIDNDSFSTRSLVPFDRQQHDNESIFSSGIGSAGGLLSATISEVDTHEIDSTHLRDEEDLDFEAEFEDVEADGGSDLDVNAAWKAKKKHFLILSAAGKPIYTRHGSHLTISSYIAIIQTIISSYSAASNQLKSFQAGKAKFVIMSQSNLFLVAISSLQESESQLRIQLDALYMQILSTLTLPTLTHIFSVRPSSDLRRPLQGTEVLLSSLADTFTRGSPSTLLSGLECLKLRKSYRNVINNTLIKARVDELLYGLVVAGGRLVSVIRPKKHSLHPGDLHLIFNMLFEAEGIKAGGGDSWIPICLPGFNKTGYLFMYVNYLDMGSHTVREVEADEKIAKEDAVAIILLSADRESFGSLQSMKNYVVHEMRRNRSMDIVQRAVQAGRPQPTDIVPGTVLRHFLFKSRANVQFFMPSLSPQFDDLNRRRQLMTIYHLLHASVHAKHASVKVHHRVSHTSSALAWVTPMFELYCVAGPNTPRNALAQSANKVVQWIQREEERVFIIGGAVF